MGLTAYPAAGSKLRASVLQALISELRATEVRVGSDQSLTTSSTTLQNVTDLVAPLLANATYQVMCVLSASVASGSTEDIQYGFSWPTGSTADFFTHGPATTATSGTNAPDMQTLSRIAATSGTTTVAIGTTTLTAMTLIHFRIAVGGTPGDLQVMAAQNTSGTNVVKVNAGSFMTVRRVG